ncbi:GNAT family N-acetyltransferase [Colwellia psychrerythraea]|uniref:GCN5-related N-acetyltransferase n=1 Tax=Colwellia psychrerythraea TaxID=28229 RepID=A0A099K9E3_COLPS|nr:GNAT family N-acetyltransferase [Colwellia psychrerythraea]KGJ86971.1 GCN5-related N-acetyltransferase [Colwellia psychrerythraea]
MDIKNSERLKFRLMDSADAQALWEIDQDPAVMKFLNGGTPTSIEQVNKVFIPRMNAYRNNELGWGIWQVSDKVSNEYLGWVLIRPMSFFTESPNTKDLELGWRFFQATWGKGYATEAAIAIRDAVIANTDVTHVSALAVADNLASIGVMKKMGMNFVRAYLHEDPIGDFDAVHYQMAVNNK